MANQAQLKLIKRGVIFWNNWIAENKNIKIDLSNADLAKHNLQGAYLYEADLRSAHLSHTHLKGANLSRANLSNSDLQGAELQGTDLTRADLRKANLSKAQLSIPGNLEAFFYRGGLSGEPNYIVANLVGANLEGAIMIGANLSKVDLSEVNLSGADLSGANLSGAQLSKTNLSRTNLIHVNLMAANCSETDFSESYIENAKVYGISTWDIKTKGSTQKNLIITKRGEPKITVDNLEVAQFIYLMLNNEKIRDVIGTIANKGVLILGRFTPERKKILDAIREKLREHDFVPMMFDFEKVSSKDFTETIKILAGMSKFVVADITNPKSSPLELQATIPDYKIPFLPIIQKGESPFSMFNDLTIYPWVLDLIEYDSEIELMKGFQKGIISRALEANKKLLEIRDKTIKPPKNINDLEN